MGDKNNEYGTIKTSVGQGRVSSVQENTDYHTEGVGFPVVKNVYFIANFSNHTIGKKINQEIFLILDMQTCLWGD